MTMSPAQYVARYDAETGITYVTLSGVITHPILCRYLTQAAAFMKTHESRRSLTDARAVIDWQLKTFEIYTLPVTITQSFMTHDLEVANLRRALVISSHTAETKFFQVVEQANLTRGFFFDTTTATEWLLRD